MRRNSKWSTIVLSILLLLSLVISFLMYMEKQKLEKFISNELLYRTNSLISCTNNSALLLDEIMQNNRILKEEVSSITGCFDTIQKDFEYFIQLSEKVNGDILNDRNRLDVMMGTMSHYLRQTFHDDVQTLDSDKSKRIQKMKNIVDEVLVVVTTSFPQSSVSGFEEDYYSQERNKYWKNREWRDFMSNIESYSKQLADNYVTQIVN